MGADYLRGLLANHAPLLYYVQATAHTPDVDGLIWIGGEVFTGLTDKERDFERAQEEQARAERQRAIDAIVHRAEKALRAQILKTVAGALAGYGNAAVSNVLKQVAGGAISLDSLSSYADEMGRLANQRAELEATIPEVTVIGHPEIALSVITIVSQKGKDGSRRPSDSRVKEDQRRREEEGRKKEERRREEERRQEEEQRRQEDTGRASERDADRVQEREGRERTCTVYQQDPRTTLTVCKDNGYPRPDDGGGEEGITERLERARKWAEIMGLSMDSSERLEDDLGARLRIGQMQRWLDAAGMFIHTVEQVGDENPARLNLSRIREWGEAAGVGASPGAGDEWYYVEGKNGWGMLGAALA